MSATLDPSAATPTTLPPPDPAGRGWILAGIGAGAAGIVGVVVAAGLLRPGPGA